MLSRMPRNIPPADLAVRIKVAARSSAAFAGLAHPYAPHQGIAPKFCSITYSAPTDRSGHPADSSPLSLVFVLVLQMIVPGTTVRARPVTTWLSI